MSEAAQQNPDEQQLVKEVTLVAYGNEQTKRSKDEFVQALTGKNVAERRTTSTTKRSIELDLGGTFPNRVRVHDNYDEEELDKFKRSLANSKMSDYIDINEETTTSKKRVTSITSAVSSFMGLIWENLPEEVDGLSQRENSGVWLNDMEEAEIRVRKPDIEEMRVLSKESKRESDDLYETISERWCGKLLITISGPNQEQLDTRSDAIIPEVHKMFSKIDGVGKVRYMACTVTEQRKGECYDI